MAKDAKAARSPTKVLGQSEHIKDLVAECAEELSSVNVALKHELGVQSTRLHPKQRRDLTGREL